MAQKGWSSLPVDLVNRVSDCLLATNDIDCYTDMRAVCHHRRSSTADPVSDQHEPRFRPSRWIMLDEHKASSSAVATLLFVNTATGRYLQRRLPFLHDGGCYVFVTSTTDGLLVLAGRDPPYAVSVLNPFTGSLIRFAAPLPSESQSQPRPRLKIRLTADVVGSSPTLVLVSVARSWVYWAEPQSESFSVVKSHRDCPASRLPQLAAAINREGISVPGAKQNIFDQLRSESEEGEGCRWYAVVAGGGAMLAVLKRPRGIDVFKIDAAGNVIERVNSIGSQALFLGVRCPVVDTDCFPTVEANCAYFQLTDNRGLMLGQRYIYKFNIGTCDDEEPFVSEAMGNSTNYLLCNFGPFTLTQFLSNYTMDIPCHPLTWEMSSSHLELEDSVDVDCYQEYIDWLDDESDEDYGYQPYDVDDYSDNGGYDPLFNTIAEAFNLYRY